MKADRMTCSKRKGKENCEKKMSGSEKIWQRHIHRGTIIDGDVRGMEGGRRSIRFSDLVCACDLGLCLACNSFFECVHRIKKITDHKNNKT